MHRELRVIFHVMLGLNVVEAIYVITVTECLQFFSDSISVVLLRGRYIVREFHVAT